MPGLGDQWADAEGSRLATAVVMLPLPASLADGLWLRVPSQSEGRIGPYPWDGRKLPVAGDSALVGYDENGNLWVLKVLGTGADV